MQNQLRQALGYAQPAESNMNVYKVKIEINAEVEAFSEEDAVDYANDIFGIDDEVKTVKVVSVKEK